MKLRSESPDDTRKAARELAAALAGEGLVIGLVGPLGAGKTLFVKGLAEGLGVDPRVVASPTFVIASEYPAAPGAPRLAHVDLYRLESRAELEATGFADLLAPDVVVAVEWADRFPDALPAERLEVQLARSSDASAPERRELAAVAFGAAAERVLARWEAALGR